MPRSKKRRVSAATADKHRGTLQGRPKRRLNRWQGLFILTALAVGAAGLWSWQASREAEQAFLDRTEGGKGALADVPRLPNQGRGHLSPTDVVDYGDWPPTSGPHDPAWVEPGIYQEAPDNRQLVHSLEHGLIVIYFDDPGADALETLKGWTDLYDGPWSGIVLIRKSELGETVVLTAWRRVLRLDTFDANAAAAFIDAFRGRGPEKPVR